MHPDISAHFPTVLPFVSLCYCVLIVFSLLFCGQILIAEVVAVVVVVVVVVAVWDDWDDWGGSWLLFCFDPAFVGHTLKVIDSDATLELASCCTTAPGSKYVNGTHILHIYKVENNGDHLAYLAKSEPNGTKEYQDQTVL